MAIVIELNDKSNCTGCSACVQVCPQGCFVMKEDSEGFKYPTVSKNSCVNCKLCEKVCPVINDGSKQMDKEPITFAAYNKNDFQRIQSSSGGLFVLLAEHVLKQNGVVFGARMSDDCRYAYHEVVDSLEKLSKLLGSKYLQSDVTDTYSRVKNYLNSGVKVLYSGTPCQIAGLKAYLRKDYDNLFCLDIICHGAPSPKLWRKYIDYQENNNDASLRQVSFRCKEKSWKSYSVSFNYSNDKRREIVYTKDPYMLMFLQNLCLRPSCYQCKFKGLNRYSDITLGDFWGCQKVCPELDDDKGLSAVIVNSAKGEQLFDSIKKNLIYKSEELEQIIDGNPSYSKPSFCPSARDDFMSKLDELTISELANGYLAKDSLKVKVIRKIKCLVHCCIKKIQK